ncbi:isoprenylcysteine carboxylmethyltransferase family protein [Pseudomonas sp. RIT-PI-AD]|uniref:methyltransferase family protein n=1 Tax=Pseudomonas sp. RIT-PI-AD TaxID=3035294 RepID=UPI0021DB33F0|nr:isoprenylcysteine carboxylmethyltransferase family protein [Pseudomonas sp. RIT-PI-AD]
MNTLLRRFPALLLPIALVALAWALWREWSLRVESPHAFAALLIALHLVWIFFELKITLRTSREESGSADRGTLQFYGLARFATIVAALYGAPLHWQQWHAWLLAPAVLFVLGIAIRLTAIKTLGDFYSHQVRVIEGHQVVQSGPYRWVRHPAYSGMLLAEFGFVLYFANLPGLLGFFCLLLPSIVVRIRVEERALNATVSGYGHYAQRHKRIIPGVW